MSTPPQGPPDKWYKLQLATETDHNAISSTALLDWLNNYPVPGMFTFKCLDGTFLFLGLYQN